MPEVKRRNERLTVLLVLGALALNYPLLALFSKVRLFLGIPVLYLYIFTAWSLYIVGMALVLEKRPPPSMTSSSAKSRKSE